MCVPFVEMKTNQCWKEMKQTEEFLSAEASKLTTEERAKALDDLHCVGEEPTESFENVGKMLEQFENFVKLMQSPIYSRAVRQNRAYVEDPYFRLRFLRCNLYDVHRSVVQMMNFLEHKELYFGNDKLAREITLDDLSEEDMGLMLSGLYHIQKERDRSGRVIVEVLWDMFGRVKFENLIHIAYYIANCILVSMLEVQMKGVCVILYDLKEPGENYVAPRLDFLLSACTVFATFPLRYSAIHVCLKPARGNLSFTNSVLRNTFNLLPSYSRVRTRLHYGTDIEVQYYLRPHGIPTQSFPIDLDGKIRWEIMNAWFYKHKEEIESQRQPGGFAAIAREGATHNEEGLVERSRRVPSKQDVLLGRGWKIQNHEGNKRFRSLLLARSAEYDDAHRLQKREIARRYVLMLRRQGVRFWKQTQDGVMWVEITTEEAENKVGQMFRTIRKNTRS